MSKRENAADPVETVQREIDEAEHVIGEEQDIHQEATTGQTDDAGEEQTEQTHEDNNLAIKLEESIKEANDYQQRWLRAQADFDNFRRRSRQEKEEFAKYASMQLIEQLLPVLDNFDRAIASGRDTNDVESVVKGIEMILRQLDQVLEKEGLQPMEAVGKPFDPEFHQAVAQVESDEHDEGTVVSELQKGYMLKDKVLRPAMVQVSK